MTHTDIFGSLLALRSRLVYAGGVCGRWAIDHNSDAAVWFHLMTHGQGWIHYPDRGPPVALSAGDLVVFMPHAQTHHFSYSPHELRFGDPGARKVRFEGSDTGWACTVIELGLPRAQVLQLLPPEILVRHDEAGRTLADLVRLTIDEARQQRFGSLPLLERLCDSLFVLALRHGIERGLVQQGLLAAVQDRRLETVLGLIHREPWLPWTVDQLCAQAGISRSVLTERFARTLGCTPGEYLVRWRMQTAAQLLRETALPLPLIAERCGYASVSAFASRFRRSHGLAPGMFRRQRGP